MKAILASSLGGQIKVDGKRIPTKLMENNGLLDIIRSSWKENSNILIISGSPAFYDKNDSVLFCLRESFSLSGLSFKDFLMCDERNTEIINRLPETDVLILAGGHVPSQNAFFKELKLKERLSGWDGLLIAWSAGSMNCAETVYAGPELLGEALDPEYQRWTEGLGITGINIFPHFEELKDEMLDGMRLIEDITYSDSFGHEIIALNNGSYIVIENGTETLYGEAYSIKNGTQKQICENGKSVATWN
ncbi:MAG: Type 1 glutamine amidotransferase-like domain-containing protein [Lachnospiraceae bacterium]|nr:Type 1 glutamine amidotransferase-like domain-containing protein [Lachnospiraceae bacterium]